MTHVQKNIKNHRSCALSAMGGSAGKISQVHSENRCKGRVLPLQHAWCGPERVCAVRIRPGQAGLTVLDCITDRFTYLGREQWQQELAAGRILVNGKVAAPLQKLVAGDELAYRRAEAVEPPVATDFRVIYEDQDLLVVDKPAPLPCHPAGRYFRHTLWAMLRELPGLASPFFINRLDRETSGLVLVAKHQEAARCCARQWQERRVEKRYLVMVEGMFPLPEMEANGSLAPDPGSVIRKKARFFPSSMAAPMGSRHCATHLRRLASGNGMTLLEARPLTGRCHQIRATLCSLGFPVVGDKMYGVDEEFFLRFLEGRLSAEDWLRLRLPRQALHGAELVLSHPADHRLLRFSSPLPWAMENLLA